MLYVERWTHLRRTSNTVLISASRSVKYTWPVQVRSLDVKDLSVGFRWPTMSVWNLVRNELSQFAGQPIQHSSTGTTSQGRNLLSDRRP